MTEPTQRTTTYKEMYMSNGAQPGNEPNQSKVTGAGDLGGGVGSAQVREVEMSKVELSGDALLAQIRAMQEQSQESPSKTPRRPDVRGVVVNTTGEQIQFFNPGKHSDKPETIQAGEACMIMFQGATPAEQMENAVQLFAIYDLHNGVNQAFIDELGNGNASSMIAECYGPEKNYQGAADKLKDVTWTDVDGAETTIAPSKGVAGAFGVRPPAEEEVYQIKTSSAVFDAALAGTNTVAENFENGRMFLAVGSDWQTGRISTRPIVPSRAKEFYGSHVVDIPTYVVDASGALSKEQPANNTSWPAQ
jgi:hypothetical protein